MMKKNRSDEIPEDVYVGFVRSLFGDAGILLIGAFCHGVIGALVFERTGEPVYLVLTIAMLAAGLYRYYAIRKVDTSTIVDQESALRWERYYIFTGSVQGVMSGLFGFVAIYLLPDVFGQLAALAVVMGGTITIAGRNYGSRKMVMILSVAVVAPIALALMLKGDIYHACLGLFIFPFMMIIMKMAERVRTVLFTAISEEKKANRLAQRFDRALNTMSHGLVMLNPEEQAVVANARAAEMLGFQSSDRLLGRSLRALLMRGAAGNLLSIEDCETLAGQLSRALHDGRDRKLRLKLLDGRYLEFTAREGRDELGVITFEEVTQRVEAEEKIRYMARYDSLTGLPNRAYFHEMVTELLGSGRRARLCGLAVFDLDDFKSINDTLGHPVGDGLIFAIAERLAGFAGERVKVSRFGGDEFMVFVNELSDEAEFATLLDGIFTGMHGDVDVAGHALRVQVSAGAVLSTARDADVDAMIVKADLALYKAKELGKNGWQLFETSMDAAFRNRQIMKVDLRSAIEARNLRVVYQPIVSMATMRIEACEALCRWDHPELGPISPSVFIPLAEEMGVVSEISSFVLSEACRECARWPEHISVSVNLSANDFRNRDVVGRVQGALATASLAPHRLEIEVTETALLDDKASTRKYIEDLKALGVGIALDDFGTGYSSLSYLHTLPLDKVKIDGSFLVDVTRNERSLELLKGIADLSRRLGLRVTVEGVETFDQLKMLVLHVHPDLSQGFLFGSALTASGIETMAENVWPFAKDITKAGKRATA